MGEQGIQGDLQAIQTPVALCTVGDGTDRALGSGQANSESMSSP